MKIKFGILLATILLSGNAASSYKIVMGTEKIKIPEQTTIPFTQHTFTTCGETGRFGPTISQCQQAYTNSEIDTENSEQYSVSNGIQIWTVPQTATYEIKAYGAQGGSTTYGGNIGGKGAYVKGDFELIKGQKISMLIGQRGQTNQRTGGGGGGTFVVKNESSPTISNILLVAGGGGGGGDSGGHGYVGLISESGGKGHPKYDGGTDGYGSTFGGNGGWGQSGAGFRGDGNGYTSVSYGNGATAKSYLNGGTGAEKPSGNTASFGGFGGGASGGNNGGGGAGGYSGGGAGGGGGGSKNNGANPDGVAGNNAGEGRVVITKL